MIYRSFARENVEMALVDAQCLDQHLDFTREKAPLSSSLDNRDQVIPVTCYSFTRLVQSSRLTEEHQSIQGQSAKGHTPIDLRTQ